LTPLHNDELPPEGAEWLFPRNETCMVGRTDRKLVNSPTVLHGFRIKDSTRIKMKVICLRL